MGGIELNSAETVNWELNGTIKNVFELPRATRIHRSQMDLNGNDRIGKDLKGIERKYTEKGGIQRTPELRRVESSEIEQKRAEMKKLRRKSRDCRLKRVW